MNHSAHTHVFMGVLFRVTILAEWLRYFIGLAVGETAAKPMKWLYMQTSE